MRCLNYCGVNCVNGHCPITLHNEYPEFYSEEISCNECYLYKGYEDCAFYDDENNYCEIIGEFEWQEKLPKKTF